jgi:ATP-dependent helicase/nuclease subunit A
VDGARPEGLLCVTFTKAAAAEMSNRIHRRLSDWTQMSDRELDKAIRGLDGGEVTDAKRARARRLFATVLDLPGGLRIRTIHSFCQSVLGRFPLEAEISPNFTALDEREAAEAMLLARDTVLTAARDAGPLADALAAVTTRVQEDVFARLMAGLSGRRRALRDALTDLGGIEGAVDRLYDILGAARGVSEADVIAEACHAGPGGPDEIGLRLAADALRDHGSDPNRKKARAIHAWLAGGQGTRAARFDAYFGEFITQKGTANSRMFVKAVAENSPATPGVIEAEQSRLLAVDARLRRQATAAASEGLLRLGEAILNAYEQRKRATAVLDYDDLIQKTAELLTADRVPWVLFKLDGGLSHMLIDEAQDTSPDQRAIVDALVAEFFAGAGGHADRRTLFVVGDAKQSIFSFQGADPEGYSKWRETLARDAANLGGEGLRGVDMQVSFRSVQAVLDAVDATFADLPAADGVVEPGTLAHFASDKKAGIKGRVELWPPTTPPERIEADLFLPPAEADAIAEADATETLARGLARTVKRWIDEKDVLPSRGRPIRPGDILFLVRNRTTLIDALSRELTTLGVPVAGVDRMTLTEQIVVMDMLCLGRALLLPQDDLTLAALLKSPFVGFDDDDLFALAHGRGKGKSLWRRLEEKRDDDARFAAALDWFNGLLAETDRLPPYELFQHVLVGRCPGPTRDAETPHSGRQALVARLGLEVEDPLDEFLNLALDFDRRHTSSLEGFLAWFAGDNTDLKRDLETEARDEVRIMTAHGAKGLQAPVVILPDALKKSGARGAALRWFPLDRDGETGALPIWTPRARFEEPVALSLKEEEARAEDREYRRLLYVAMTRAEDRLIVTGRLPRTAPTAGNWYELVRDGMERLPDVREVPFDALDTWSGTALVFESGDRVAEPEGRAAPEEPTAASEPIPGWLATPPPPEPSPPRPLAPSRPSNDDPAARSPLLVSDGAALTRGRLIHRLLQTLPDLPEGERDAAARRFLALPGHGLSPEAREALAAESLAVLRTPAFAPLFGPDSRAEVPLAGLIDGPDGPRALSGQVDRLLITGREILVVDYKTLRPAPADPAKVPPAYLSQMAGYRAILRGIFPDRPVRCALVFTETPRLVSIPDALMDSRPALDSTSPPA